jgi:hypothetical protein
MMTSQNNVLFGDACRQQRRGNAVFGPVDFDVELIMVNANIEGCIPNVFATCLTDGM